MSSIGHFEVYYPERPHPVLIDVEDAEFYFNRRWYYKKAYYTGFGREYKKARLTTADKNKTDFARLLLNVPKGLGVDHKSGNALDNRRNNLREATTAQNTMNSKKRKYCSSKYIGVSFQKQCKERPWHSYIQDKGKTISIGYYKTEQEAALAYNKMAAQLFGVFARLNAIERSVD